MNKIILMVIVLIALTVDMPCTTTFPGNPFKTQPAEAKTYYDWNTDGFKSVNEKSGQTFDYNTGNYGKDYSYTN